MTQNCIEKAQEIYSNEIKNTCMDMVKAMFGDAAVRDEQFEDLLGEFQSYLEGEEKLIDLLKMYSAREAAQRLPLAKSVCKMFLMEKLFKKA